MIPLCQYIHQIFLKWIFVFLMPLKICHSTLNRVDNFQSYVKAFHKGG